MTDRPAHDAHHEGTPHEDDPADRSVDDPGTAKALGIVLAVLVASVAVFALVIGAGWAVVSLLDGVG